MSAQLLDRAGDARRCRRRPNGRRSPCSVASLVMKKCPAITASRRAALKVDGVGLDAAAVATGAGGIVARTGPDAPNDRAWPQPQSAAVRR